MQTHRKLRRWLWLNLTFILLATFSIAVSTQSVYAVDFPVTKTDDTADGTCDADCSLREAIIAANAAAGADTITLPTGTYVLTITGINEDGSATGDLDITDDLTINGADETTTIIDGGAIDRVLQVLTGTVTLNDITIQNGDAFDLGGGIRNGDTLLVNNSTISSNTGYGGGGIYSSNTDYMLVTSEQANGPTYAFNDISGSGRALGLGGSGSSLEAIGFDFTFFGESHQSVYVSSEGFLTFVANDLTDNGINGSPKMTRSQRMQCSPSGIIWPKVVVISMLKPKAFHPINSSLFSITM